MTTIDFLLLGICVLSAVMGLFRGFVKEALSLLAWVIAAWCAWRFAAAVAPRIPGFGGDSMLQIWIARAVILVVVLIICGLASRLISYLLHQSGLSGTDRSLGAVFGMARGVVLVGLVVLLLGAAGFDSDPWWDESKLIPYAAPMAQRLRDLADDGIDRLQERDSPIEFPAGLQQ